MKAIMMSIKPKWIEKILNKEKTIEIRKRFPVDYVGWVYIYCTKPTKHTQLLNRDRLSGKWKLWFGTYTPKNGKVIARFWCNKVEEIPPIWQWRNSIFNWEKWLIDKGCVSQKELFTYLKVHNPQNCGYAIHITNLEIFDKPKEISEFKYYKKFSEIDYMLPIPRKETCERLVALTRAPESWQFIEI